VVSDDEEPVSMLEEEIRRFWAGRGLPPTDGPLGRGTGPVLRQLIGNYVPGDPPVLVAHRAVIADVEARVRVLSGDRAFGTLRRAGWPPEALDPTVAPLLVALGVWTGGSGHRPYDAEDRTAGVQTIVGRLASAGIFVAREGPVRLCPACAAPRSPERTFYHEELGDTFLVRFPLEPEGEEPAVEALAWVDAPWRLLGATALLVNPDLPYATVEYRRGEVTGRLLTLRSSLARLQSWFSGVELKVVGERPGRAYEGRRYVYPLRHEFPDGTSLPPPSGQVHAVVEVGDSGTGVVPLVPGHGGTDALIAERIGVVGWPLLTVRGTMDTTIMHKYSGLDLDTANEFVARDLTDDGSVVARLRVLRGVPYCGVCGRPVVWFPGRCWSLELSALPAERQALYSRLLPGEGPLLPNEPTPWPVSETTTATDPGVVRLLECERCSRLEVPEKSGPCPCGGKRRVVGRRLLPSISGALAAWARNDPVPAGDIVRLYVGERRKAAMVIHALTAFAGVSSRGADLEATIVPTVSDIDVPDLVRSYGADAVRTAFVRTTVSEGPGRGFVERCRQESGRLARLRQLGSSVSALLGRGEARGSAAPVGSSDPELQPEDRALLARWRRTELRALAAYDEQHAALAHRLVVRFLEVDLARYGEIVRSRLEPSAPTASRRAAARTLATVINALATALGPIAPFSAEAIVRSLWDEPRSLFETSPFDVERPPPDEALATAWERWLSVVGAMDRFRTAHRLPPRTEIPSAAIIVGDEAVADQLRGDRALLERLAGVRRLEVGSPRTPWEGRQRRLVPVESEIQRAYPMLATQIVHLLHRMPARRSAEADGRGVSLFVQGQPHQITPSMLTAVEILPERVVPTPCSLGEMYAELPSGGMSASGELPIALSTDASWLVRRLVRRLRSLDPEGARSAAVRVVAIDPLAKELREHWAALAKNLGVASLTIDPPSADGPAVAPTITGRTRLGARWSVEIPGVGPRIAGGRRQSGRVSHAASRRMPMRRRPGLSSSPEVDFADPPVIQRGEEVRALGEELDKLLGAPLLGPAKVSLAWEAGYSSRAELEQASFDELATLPGFGRAVAAQLFEKTGRAVPPPPPRPPRVRLEVPREPEPRPPAELEAPAAVPLPLGAGEPPVPPTAIVVAPLEPPTGPPVLAEAAPSMEGRTPAEPTPEGPLETPAAPLAPVPVLPPPAVRAPPPPLQPAFIPDSQLPVAPPPAPLPVQSGLEVEVSDALQGALQPFLDATAAGHRGLAVVRELPERIRALVGPRPVAVYWLSNLSRDRTIRPGDLTSLATLLRQGIEENGITALFLEGIEYLSRIHGATAIAEFLKELDREARSHDARAWLHLTRGLLSEAELTNLAEAAGVPVQGALPPEPPEPTEPPA
jgi:Protein of unknown function (DUF835)/Anticodon-binding domain of tRNA ligase/Helix-hairpin-helix domain